MMKKISLIGISIILIIGAVLFPTLYMRHVINRDKGIIGEQVIESDKLVFSKTGSQIYMNLLMLDERIDTDCEEEELSDQNVDLYVQELETQWKNLYKMNLCPVEPISKDAETGVAVGIHKYNEKVFYKYSCDILQITLMYASGKAEATICLDDNLFYSIRITKTNEEIDTPKEYLSLCNTELDDELKHSILKLPIQVKQSSIDSIISITESIDKIEDDVMVEAKRSENEALYHLITVE